MKENFINIHVLAIISIRETIEKLVQKYPKVAFTIAMEDDGLKSQGYITPGVGDLGDRLYGKIIW